MSAEASCPRCLPAEVLLRETKAGLLGKTQNEYDYDHGYGSYGTSRTRNGETDGRRYPKQIFFALLLTIPILAYSMGRTMFSWNLPSPLPIPWLLLFSLHQYSFIVVGYSSIHPILSLRRCVSACQFSLLLVLLLRTGFSSVLNLVSSTDSYYEAAAMLITFVLLATGWK